MPMQQRFCKFCISSSRAFSSFRALQEFPLSGKTFSRHIDSNEKCLFPSKLSVLNLMGQHERYLHCSRRHGISSVFPSQDNNATGTVTEVDSTKRLYKDVLESFPSGIQMAFAYGSGAVQQDKGKDKSQNMLDLIFVVDEPLTWHKMNLEQHPHHYSFLKRFGPQAVTKVQESYGAGIYFNTLVSMHGRLIKYGIISTARLVADLLDWESLYVSGRLQKPVNLITVPKDETLVKGLIVNLESAVHTALLLLPDVFTEEQLYFTIASLSYSGDIRMAVAEDSNKVRNIVSPNVWFFRRMYLPIVMRQECVVYAPETGHLEQTLNFESRYYHLTQLPCQVLHGLVMQKHQAGLFPDLEEVISLHAYDKECGKYVFRSIKTIVKNSSASQTMKGILTAGFSKSIRYGFSKVSKKVKSR